MIIHGLQYSGACDCGREHRMETLLSVVESGCLNRIDQYLADADLSGYKVAVYDENTYKATADRHPSADLEVILDPVNLHANENGVALLMQQLPDQLDVLIAVGSGTIHDITRYCAYQKKVDFVSCPTAASVDGFCSSVAAMTWHGCKKTLTAVAPKLVVADLDVIKKAPVRLAKSGFGDMVGKYIALTDWKIAHILTGEFYCKTIAQMTLDATEAVLRSARGILAGEESAFADLMYGLLMSGLAMQMMGNSRPASGAEHHISHIIEMEPEGLSIHSDALHGEKVGVGTLLVAEEYLHIRNMDAQDFCDYHPWSKDEIHCIFCSEMTEEICKENEKDAGFGITGERIRACWTDICEAIDQIPDVHVLRAMYQELGIISTLSEIGVNNELVKTLLACSPMVRNRLTLMRLRKCMYPKQMDRCT